MKKEKNKLTKCTMILSAVLLLSVSVSGCGQDKKVPVTEVTSQTEESDEGFDFAGALKSTRICGHRLSYPLTWGQFKDYLKIDMETWNPQYGNVIFDVTYKGKRIGNFLVYDCDDIDMLKSDSRIGMLYLSSLDYNGRKPLLSVKGLTFDNKRSEFRDILDDKFRKTDVRTMDTYTRHDYGAFSFTYDLKDEETLLYFSIGQTNE